MARMPRLLRTPSERGSSVPNSFGCSPRDAVVDPGALRRTGPSRRARRRSVRVHRALFGSSAHGRRGETARSARCCAVSAGFMLLARYSKPARRRSASKVAPATARRARGPCVRADPRTRQCFVLAAALADAPQQETLGFECADRIGAIALALPFERTAEEGFGLVEYLDRAIRAADSRLDVGELRFVAGEIALRAIGGLIEHLPQQLRIESARLFRLTCRRARSTGSRRGCDCVQPRASRAARLLRRACVRPAPAAVRGGPRRVQSRAR